MAVQSRNAIQNNQHCLSVVDMIIIPKRRNFLYDFNPPKGTNCKLLIHSDTTDGSTTFTDSSGQGHTISVDAVDVEHDVDQKMFRATSILFDGDSGYLGINPHADFEYGTGDFTIDLRGRFASVASNCVLISYQDNADHYWTLGYNQTSNWMYFVAYNSTNLVISLTTSGTFSPVANAWYHFAVLRGWNDDNDKFALTVNGTAKAVGNYSASNTMPGGLSLPDKLTIGKKAPSASPYMNGWLDEIRIVKGTAMWTDGFRSPLGPYS